MTSLARFGLLPRGVVFLLLAAAWHAVGCRPGPSPSAPPNALPTADRESRAQPAATAIRLDDVAPAAGVEFVYRNDEEQERAAILEAVGGGVALLDYDRDGALDLFFPGGGRYVGTQGLAGRPLELFRREANWSYAPVASPAGVAESRYYSHGAATADFDNDGFPDLLVTGYGGLALYRNQGDGSFIEVASSAGLSDLAWPTSAAWGDLNQDGALDLFVVQYLNWSFENDPACPSKSGRRDWCSPQAFQPLPDRLFLSDGAGGFRDASTQYGVRADGKGLGVVIADLDVDGDPDVYVANDATPNFLYRNDGPEGWREVGLSSGSSLDKVGAADGSMGVDVGDFNGDGLPDLWVVNFEQELFALYQNLGNGLYLHATDAAGLAAEGGLYVGWGTALCDLDRDADLDLVTANGHAFRFPAHAPRRQRPLVFENLGRRRFRNVAASTGAYGAGAHDGRGLATGDLDDDGRVDVVISHLNEPVAVLRNRSSGDRPWIGLKLVGRASPRDAVGAVVRVQTPQGEQLAQVKGGGSYLSANDSRLVFGLGESPAIEAIRIAWPSGRRQTLERPEANRYLTIIEPD